MRTILILDFPITKGYPSHMTYSWQNEDGEPIMSGEAWRFEQQLDMDAQDDYLADHFYDDDYDEECDGVRDICPHGGCAGCDDDEPEFDGMEDQHLDGYWEDRMTTMFE